MRRLSLIGEMRHISGKVTEKKARLEGVRILREG